MMVQVGVEVSSPLLFSGIPPPLGVPAEGHLPRSPLGVEASVVGGRGWRSSSALMEAKIHDLDSEDKHEDSFSQVW